MIGRIIACKTRVDVETYLLSVGWDVCTLTWRHWHDNDSFKKDGKHAYRRRAKPGPRRGRHPPSSVLGMTQSVDHRKSVIGLHNSVTTRLHSIVCMTVLSGATSHC